MVEKKKPVWKKWWFWLLMIIALLFVIAVVFSAISYGRTKSDNIVLDEYSQCIATLDRPYDLYGQCAHILKKVQNVTKYTGSL